MLISSQVACTALESPLVGKLIAPGKGSHVRVVVMSDIHSKEAIYFAGEDVRQSTFSSLPRGDILIIAGDFTQSGQIEEFQSFNCFLTAISEREIYRHIVLVPGNHERTLDENFYRSEGWKYDRIVQNPVACREALFTNLPRNVHFLQDSSVTLEGLVIYGTPWVIGGDLFFSESSTGHYRWGFSLPEASLEDKWRMIPLNTDILITHQPPYGAGDKRRNYDLDAIIDDKQIAGFDHKGSISLSQAVKRVQPILHVCGHEHCGHGAYMYPDCPTLILNASVCDEDYVPSNSLLVAELQSRNSVACFYTVGEGENCTSMVYDTYGMDLYIASILSIEMNSISLTAGEQEVFNYFLRLVTCPPDELIKDNQIPPNLTPPLSRVNSFRRMLRMSHNFTVKSLIDHFRGMIFSILDNYSLLNNLYYSRCLCRGANTESSQDFRKMQLVIPRIYLGPEYAAQDLSYLREVGITHVINLSGTPPAFPSDVEYLMLEVEDVSEADISKYFFIAIEWMTATLRMSTNKILVHCRLGLSRSPTIIIAYLMQVRNISFTIAHSIVKRARGFITINNGFLKQLMDLDLSSTREGKLYSLVERR